MSACGKKGPPLPPLVRVPQPPADFTAERRGEEVKLQFTVPSVNTDGTRPADVDRVDVYRFTGPAAATDEDLVKLGTKVASVPVKAPQNPDLATGPDEPAEEPELKDEGINQGSVALLEDTLVPSALTPVALPKKGRPVVAATTVDGPLVGPPPVIASTSYVIIGINTKGRKGPLSKRVLVPLVPPPGPPTALEIAYTETAITVTWEASPSGMPIQEAPKDDELRGHTIGIVVPTYSYHVYDVSPSASEAAAASDVPAAGNAPALAGQVRLTRAPVPETSYADARIEWGTTRCYTVRTVETIGGLALESDAPEPECTTLKDTFPPTAPKDLRLIPTEGEISLIWEPAGESDLAGYLVLRGTTAEMLEPITPAAIANTTFNDKVMPGTQYFYVVKAVDKAGNVSPPSNRVEGLSR